MAVDITGMMKPNVILIDADYVDSVAFNLIVNFERMLERRIPKADLANWLDCVALDGGIVPGENDLQVVFIYSRKNKVMRNFVPGDLPNEIDGKAFKDGIGEFNMSAYEVAEGVTNMYDFFLDTLDVVIDSDCVKNVILVQNTEVMSDSLRAMLRNNKDKSVTILTMEPLSGRGFNTEILGYSLMNAMGIKGDEFNK